MTEESVERVVRDHHASREDAAAEAGSEGTAATEGVTERSAEGIGTGTKEVTGNALKPCLLWMYLLYRYLRSR